MEKYNSLKLLKDVRIDGSEPGAPKVFLDGTQINGVGQLGIQIEFEPTYITLKLYLDTKFHLEVIY